LSWIEELYIHVWLGGAREGLANLLMHTAFISSPECLARHISQAESARWISHSSIPVRIPSPVMPANPDLPRSVEMPKILGPSTDSNPDASGRGTADSWDALYNLGFTARASPPFPRDILGILGGSRSSAQQLGLRPTVGLGLRGLTVILRCRRQGDNQSGGVVQNPWRLAATTQGGRRSHTLPGRNGCVEYSIRSGRVASRLIKTPGSESDRSSTRMPRYSAQLGPPPHSH
jgi:hypothetical protein